MSFALAGRINNLEADTDARLDALEASAGNPTFSGTVTANALNLITVLPNDVQVSGKFLPSAGQLSAQLTLSGGGLVTWTGTHPKWDGRMYVAPVDKPELASDGIYYIDCPASGSMLIDC